MKIHRNLALARRISAAGVPIYIREDDPQEPHDPSNGLLIYQEGGLIESRAFDYYGVAAYVIRVVITVHVSRFAIASFGLELPWKGSVQWLDDPRDMGSGRHWTRWYKGRTAKRKARRSPYDFSGED